MPDRLGLGEGWPPVGDGDGSGPVRVVLGTGPTGPQVGLGVGTGSDGPLADQLGLALGSHGCELSSGLALGQVGVVLGSAGYELALGQVGVVLGSAGYGLPGGLAPGWLLAGQLGVALGSHGCELTSGLALSVPLGWGGIRLGEGHGYGPPAGLRAGVVAARASGVIPMAAMVRAAMPEVVVATRRRCAWRSARSARFTGRASSARSPMAVRMSSSRSAVIRSPFRRG